MNDGANTLTTAFEEKTKVFLTKLLKLDDDIDLKLDADLIQQIGLDSIEAFDAVATMHELLDVAIPDDFSPKVVNSIRSLCGYVQTRFGQTAVERFLALDLDSEALFEHDEEL